jgi:hypothetical protein
MRGRVGALTINNHSEKLSKATAIVHRQRSPSRRRGSHHASYRLRKLRAWQAGMQLQFQDGQDSFSDFPDADGFHATKIDRTFAQEARAAFDLMS